MLDVERWAHVGSVVPGAGVSMARRRSPVNRLRLWVHSKMATYCARYFLATPRKRRSRFRSPVQMPSIVLQCASRTPSPSSSRAYSGFGRACLTFTRVRPADGSRSYATHSSVWTVHPSAVNPTTSGCSVARSCRRVTASRTFPVSRPTTPSTGGRSSSHVPCPRTGLARRRGGSAGEACRSPFFPRVLVHLVGLDVPVRQGRAVQGRGRVGLQPVPQAQQLAAVPAQLA